MHIKAAMDQAWLSSLPWEELFVPLIEAEDALARLDERLHTSPIRDGWIARSHFTDACASLWLEGELVTLEDLVLHDADSDARTPTPHLLRARKIVDTRRQIVANGSVWAFSPNGLERLFGQKMIAEDDSFLTGDEDARDPLDQALADIDAVLARSSKVLVDAAPIAAQREILLLPAEVRIPVKWQRFIDAVYHLPPVLAAGLLWDEWEQEPPASRREWMARQLVCAYLAKRGKAQWHLPALHSGLRKTPWERRRSQDKLTRILTWAKAVIIAAEEGAREHDRLKMALALLERKCVARRSTSRLPELITMIGSHPLVTARMVAQKLDISQRSAQNLISTLELREISGRERYRAWML